MFFATPNKLLEEGQQRVLVRWAPLDSGFYKLNIYVAKGRGEDSFRVRFVGSFLWVVF